MTAHFAKRGPVAVITLDNPPMNGLGLATRQAFMQALRQAEQHADVHSSVITSLKEVLGSMSASTMNLATGNVFAYAASANTAFAVSGTPPDGQVAAIILDLTVIGAPRLVSFWPGVKWASGSAITSRSACTSLR